MQPALHSQTVVGAHLKSKQLLLLGFARQYGGDTCDYSLAQDRNAGQIPAQCWGYIGPLSEAMTQRLTSVLPICEVL